MRKIIFGLALLFGSAGAPSSNPSLILVASAPSCACLVNLPDYQVVTLGTIYTCQSGTWTLIGSGGGGSGSVTSVSGLSPLFTVSNPTTTPTFALSSAAGNTLFGNCTGTTAAPSYCALTLAMLPTGIPNSNLATPFVQLSGDASSTPSGGATLVQGINGVLLSGLPSGPLCNTNGTGIPTKCSASQILTTPTTGDLLSSTGTSGVVTTIHRAVKAIGQGDSFMNGLGVNDSANNGFFGQFIRDTPVPSYTNYGVAGWVTQQINVSTFQTTLHDPLMPIVYLFDGGINDANFCGAVTNCVKNMQLTVDASIAWASIPDPYRIYASASTRTGTWTANNAIVALPNTLTGSPLGTTMAASSSGATATFFVPTPASGLIGVTYLISPGNTGTSTLSIDGVNQTDFCSGTTTFSAGSCGAQAFFNGSSLAEFRQEFTSGAGTSTSITAGSVTAGVATFTATNSHVAGQQVLLSGFTGAGASLNGAIVTVLSAGLSSSQFEANVVPATIASTGAGSDLFHTVTVTTGSATAVYLTAVDWIPPTTGLYVPTNVNPVFYVDAPTNASAIGFTNAALYNTGLATTLAQENTAGLPIFLVDIVNGYPSIGNAGANLPSEYLQSTTAYCLGTSSSGHPNCSGHSAIEQTILASEATNGYMVSSYNMAGARAIAPTGAPTCQVQTAAGSGAACTISAGSTNKQGVINLNTGTGATTGVLIHVIYAGGTTVVPVNCVAFPATATTSAIVGNIIIGNGNPWSLSSVTTAIPSSASYAWTYVCNYANAD